MIYIYKDIYIYIYYIYIWYIYIWYIHMIYIYIWYIYIYMWYIYIYVYHISYIYIYIYIYMIYIYIWYMHIYKICIYIYDMYIYIYDIYIYMIYGSINLEGLPRRFSARCCRCYYRRLMPSRPWWRVGVQKDLPTNSARDGCCPKCWHLPMVRICSLGIVFECVFLWPEMSTTIGIHKTCSISGSDEWYWYESRFMGCEASRSLHNTKNDDLGVKWSVDLLLAASSVNSDY